MLRHFRRSGKVAYLDPIRAFLVEAKPEERVRQEFLHRLMGEYGFPQGVLAVEYPLQRSGSTSKWRADIVVFGADGPLMVVECKEPETRLHDGVRDQARSYADELKCAYFALTNGTDVETFHRVAGAWCRIAEFPSFDGLRAPCQLRYEAPRSRNFPALTLEELHDLDFLAEHDAKLSEDWGYCVLGQDTPEELWTPIYSLYNALFHEPAIGAHLPRARGAFRVEEYLGIHFTEYGNYSGGRFPGLYSSFRVIDANGDDQIYKIGFFSCARTENDPTFGNRKGTSGIHVAIDDFDRAPHMSLELSLDACLNLRAGALDIIHDGKITVGRLGAAKRDLLLAFVAESAPQLVHGKSVLLGTAPTGSVLGFSDISKLVFNLLHYAEIRDRFRVEYKRCRA